jgi:parvulin-like peptidyl-prolyl isomerase
MRVTGEHCADAGNPRRPQLLLGAGATVGLACAVIALLGRGAVRDRLPGDTVALVNGVAVRRETYERAVAALAADRLNPIGPEERRFVLERLIDEELLVQRGLELGLARHDRRVRAEVIAAVLSSIVAESAEGDPEVAEVAAFYAEHRDYFTRPGRLHVRQVLIRADGNGDTAGAQGRAAEAVQRLRAGEPFLAVQAALGDAETAVLPDGPIPVTTLREYLGPTVTRATLDLGPGEVSAPIRSAAGLHVVQMVAREPEETPPLSEIETEVRAEVRRRTGDRALRQYLDGLRRTADVRTREDLP